MLPKWVCSNERSDRSVLILRGYDLEQRSWSQ
jgi:hypothetical protein